MVFPHLVGLRITNVLARGASANEIIGRLAPLGTHAVLSFADQFDRATAGIHRWDVWAAGHLIANGCSDDAFSDFKAGVVAAGRDWHRHVVVDPDHPAVIRAAAGGDPYVMFAEALHYVPSHAFEGPAGWASRWPGTRCSSCFGRCPPRRRLI